MSAAGFESWATPLQGKLNSGNIETDKMTPGTLGKVSPLNSSSILISEDLLSEVVGAGGSRVGHATLAGTMAHEYTHVIEFDSVLGKIMFSSLLSIIPGGRDAFGEWRSISELGPWNVQYQVQGGMMDYYIRQMTPQKGNSKTCK